MEQFQFVVKGKTYKTEELKVGKLIDLWKMRTALSGGTYGQLYRMALVNSDEAITAIDIEAFFTVFVPDFLQDIKPGSIRDMGVEDYLELRDIFVSEIQPWLNKVEALLKKKEDA